MQLKLAFLEIPSPSTMVWEALDAEQRTAALEVLARLIAQVAEPKLGVEGDDDE